MQQQQDWRAIRSLLPYLWQFRTRVLLALGLLLLGKLANVAIPLALKKAIDALDVSQQAVIYLPVMMLVAYGVLRLASSLFSELRDVLFAKVIYQTVRKIAVQIFDHLHALSLRFHLQRQTGGISRDIERGTRGMAFLMNFMVFNILPTLAEITLVTAILLYFYPPIYALITTGTILLYIAYTLWVTEWRMKFRRKMNEMDSKANNLAIDSLLNYETVKYFNNEAYESDQYNEQLTIWQQAAIKNQISLSLLNIGQGVIIAIGLTLLMLLAGQGVVDGMLTMGDLVMINAYLLQLYLPLGFLGFVYREIRHALTDMERMFSLLEQDQETVDIAEAIDLAMSQAEVCFQHVNFHYDSNRPILKDIDFIVPAGHKVAIVGASGSGKSTLMRLLFRFYDPQSGQIKIDNVDISNLTQASLRHAIGVVPQDVVLFNGTIYHNIAYGATDADRTAVIDAAKRAHIHHFIELLPAGYDTLVGERGLKLSGGEKQRVAIARTLLKNPKILILDEATSSLDSHAEQMINQALKSLSQKRTTLVIAHRLSTIIDADQIIVMDKGVIIERGTHHKLLALAGHYAMMWALQQSENMGSTNTRDN
jgi:ATP-binding cassette subfamily B protein